MYLHPKHGLNPTLATCYYCNEPADILLVGSKTKAFKAAGLASEDGEMKMNIGVIDARPCSRCEGYMQKGVILISMRDGEEEEIGNANQEQRLPNPYRSGGWVVVQDEFIKRIVHPPELADKILKRRCCFVPDLAWNKLELPRGKSKAASSLQRFPDADR